MQLKSVRKGHSETDIEKYLCKKIKALGGKAYKFTSPGRRSVPDRLCVLPYGVIVFVEVKRPGKRPTPLQRKELNDLKELGHNALYVDSKISVNVLIGLTKKLIEYNKAQQKRIAE